MPVPIGQVPPDVAAYLEALERRVDALEVPLGPVPAWACEEAFLPLASEHLNAVVYVSDIPILAVSDGIDWRRQDSGAPI